MNDFGVDLKGKTVVVKEYPGVKKKRKEKDRTFVITGGSGCNPDMAYSRKLLGHWLDKMKDDISSYDIEKILEEKMTW